MPHENWRMRAASRHEGIAAALFLSVLLVGCVEPRYAPDPDGATSAVDAGGKRDASVADTATAREDAEAASADAGAADAAEMRDAASLGDAASDGAVVEAPWASKLPGKYAVQSMLFADDGAAVSRLKERFLGEIRAIAGGYELVLQACEQVLSAPLYTANIKTSEKLPPRRFRLTLDDDGFDAEPVDTAIGYEPEPPPECQGKEGQLVAKRLFQTWISGVSCRCPGNLIPPVDDCRVVDPDGDKLPGYTLEMNLVQPLARYEVWGVSANYSKLVSGAVRSDTALVAQWETKSTTAQYGCRPASCFDLSGPSPSCPPETSRVDFTRLDSIAGAPPVWNCAAILARAIDLFTEPDPSPPSRCGR